MAQYVASVSSIPVIVDLVDVDSDKWIQYSAHARFPWSAVYAREGKCLREYERGMADRSAALLVSTEREAALLRDSGKTPVHVISNGVDTEYFKPIEKERLMSESTIVFTGDMAYFPNQQAVEFFARYVLPLIRQQVPDAQFLIVGRNPNQQVIRLGKLPGVEVTGSVPDVRPYLARATVAVAPFLIAAGIQNKILEAMASGIPVVATTRAVQGLSAGTGALIGTGETAQELADKTYNLLNNKGHAASVGHSGRMMVLAEYSWGAALDRLLEVIESTTSSHPKVGEQFQSFGT
jgi:sugar transferase (PEP-CTERM/EpsH1 system associated)